MLAPRREGMTDLKSSIVDLIQSYAKEDVLELNDGLLRNFQMISGCLDLLDLPRNVVQTWVDLLDNIRRRKPLVNHLKSRFFYYMPRKVYAELLRAYAESNNQSEISRLPRDILQKISLFI